MKLGEIKATGKRIDNGGWVDELPNLPGISVKVRALFNSQWTKRAAELQRNLTPDQILDDKVATDLENKLLIETVVLDWRGIDDLPYSKKNVVIAITDPTLAILRRGIVYAATVVARLGKDKLEADTKN